MKEEPSSPPCRQPGSQWRQIPLAVKKEELACPPRRQLRLHNYLKDVGVDASSSKSKADTEATRQASGSVLP